MLHYYDFWYMHRPNHTQSMQNNKSTISQNILHPGRPQNFQIGTTINWVWSCMFSYTKCITGLITPLNYNAFLVHSYTHR